VRALPNQCRSTFVEVVGRVTSAIISLAWRKNQCRPAGHYALPSCLARFACGCTTLMSIYLLRHGETALNVARVLQPADTPLSPRGEAQARALAQRLGLVGLVGIVSSHMPRALQTAALIADSCALEVQQCELLQERNFGDWRGLSYDALDFNPLLSVDAPPGGESGLEFARRVAAAFKYITALRSDLNGSLGVVTHGMVIRQMLTGHLEFGSGSALPAHLGNASITRITAYLPHQVELLNCTRHLSGEHADDADSLSGG
jgi:broad specificity phosphatase PhoE